MLSVGSIQCQLMSQDSREHDTEQEYAIRAATLALSHAKDKRKELSSLIQEFPVLVEDEWFERVSAEVEETGHFSLYI